MAFITVLRVSVVLLVAVLAVPAVPDAAQSLNKADAQDFQMFRNTISVRRNARLCERSVPGYSETFEDLYATWSEKHRGEIARGESLFKQALSVRDPKRYPFIDNVTLSRLDDWPRRAGPARTGDRFDAAGRAAGGGVRKAFDVPEAMTRIS
jgi:hypothetical protein